MSPSSKRSNSSGKSKHKSSSGKSKRKSSSKSSSKSKSKTSKMKKYSNGVLMQITKTMYPLVKSNKINHLILLVNLLMTKQYNVVKNGPLLEKIQANIDSIVTKCKTTFQLSSKYTDFDIATVALMFGVLYNNKGFINLLVYLLNSTTGTAVDQTDVKVVIKDILGEQLIELGYETQIEELGGSRLQKGGSILQHIFPILSLLTCIFLMIRTHNVFQDLVVTVKVSSIADVITYGGNDYLSKIEKTCTYQPRHDSVYNMLRFINLHNVYEKLMIITECSNPYTAVEHLKEKTLENVYENLDQAWVPYLCNLYPSMCPVSSPDGTGSPDETSPEMGKQIVISDTAKNQIAVIENQLMNAPEARDTLYVFNRDVINKIKTFKNIEEIQDFTNALIINPRSVFNSNFDDKQQPNVNVLGTSYFDIAKDLVNSMLKAKMLESGYNYVTGKSGTPLQDIQFQLVTMIESFNLYLSNLSHQLSMKKTETTTDIKFKTEEAKRILAKIFAYIEALGVLFNVGGTCFAYTVMFYGYYFYGKKKLRIMDSVAAIEN